MNVENLAEKLKELPQIDLKVRHNFSDGLYAKEMHLPKGHMAISHRHHYSHLSILANGKALVKTNDETMIYTAPACIEIKAGIQHAIEALEDVTWFCIHATHVADPESVDNVLIKEI